LWFWDFFASSSALLFSWVPRLFDPPVPQPAGGSRRGSAPPRDSPAGKANVHQCRGQVLLLLLTWNSLLSFSSLPLIYLLPMLICGGSRSQTYHRLRFLLFWRCFSPTPGSRELRAVTQARPQAYHAEPPATPYSLVRLRPTAGRPVSAGERGETKGVFPFYPTSLPLFTLPLHSSLFSEILTNNEKN
jgi:hypothetical protein